MYIYTYISFYFYSDIKKRKLQKPLKYLWVAMATTIIEKFGPKIIKKSIYEINNTLYIYDL